MNVSCRFSLLGAGLNQFAFVPLATVALVIRCYGRNHLCLLTALRHLRGWISCAAIRSPPLSCHSSGSNRFLDDEPAQQKLYIFMKNDKGKILRELLELFENQKMGGEGLIFGHE